MLSVLLYCSAVLAILVLYFFYRPVEGKDEPGAGGRYRTSLTSSPSLSSSPLGDFGADSGSSSLTKSLVGHSSRRIILKQIETQYSVANRSSCYDEASAGGGAGGGGGRPARLRRRDSVSSIVTSMSSVSDSSSGFRSFSELTDSYYLVKRLKRSYAKFMAVYLPCICKYLGIGYGEQQAQLTSSAASAAVDASSSLRPTSNLISDNYRNLDELVAELVRLELINPFLNELGSLESRCSFNVVIGIDFTASNEWKGRKTFNSQSLHKTLGNKIYNPYQKVISILGLTLQKLVSATSSQTTTSAGGGGGGFLGSSASTYTSSPFKIHCYGFGDSKTTDKSVFSLFQPLPSSATMAGSLADDASILIDSTYSVDSFDDVLGRYNEVVRKLNLSGPTSFAPIIYKTIEIMKLKQMQLLGSTRASLSDSVSIVDGQLPSQSGGGGGSGGTSAGRMPYHILFIIADGKVSDENETETVQAIIDASAFPLSIIMIGVGDGPWGTMIKFDDQVCEQSKFDNFQFVDYHAVTKNSKSPDVAFALKTLMEIPEQFRIMKRLNYI